MDFNDCLPKKTNPEYSLNIQGLHCVTKGYKS